MSENSISPMDEPADINPDLPEEGFFQSRWKKFGVAMLTILVAIFIAWILVAPGNFYLLVIGILFFPMGLAYFILHKTKFGALNADYYVSTIAFFGGWLLYLGLALGLTFVGKKWLVICRFYC